MVDEAGRGAPAAEMGSTLDLPALAELLEEKEIAAALRAALQEAGLSPNTAFVLTFLIKRASKGAAVFIGKAAKARIDGFLANNETARTVLTRIARLRDGEADKAALRSKILADLAGDSGVAGIEVDHSTDLALLTQLHQGKRIDDLHEDLAGITDDLRAAIREVMGERDQPTLEWATFDAAVADLSVINRLNHLAPYGIFGRDEALEELEANLLYADGPFRWRMITADGGEGKTRLARALTERMAEKGWRAGPLSPKKLPQFEPDKWRPDRPTLFVIDYPASYPAEVNRLLTGLMENRQHYTMDVRVLILERNATGEWFKTIFPGDGESQAVELLSAGTLPERLQPVMPDAIVAMMKQRFAMAEEQAPTDEVLITAAHIIDKRLAQMEQAVIPLPRPLFAAAAAEWLMTEL